MIFQFVGCVCSVQMHVTGVITSMERSNRDRAWRFVRVCGLVVPYWWAVWGQVVKNLEDSKTVFVSACNASIAHAVITWMERSNRDRARIGEGGSSGSLWAGSPLLVGGLGTCRQEAGDILQIILQWCNLEEGKTVVVNWALSLLVLYNDGRCVWGGGFVQTQWTLWYATV